MKSTNGLDNHPLTIKNIKDRLIIFLKPLPYVDILIVFVGILLALSLRYSLRSFASQDYSYYNKVWYQTIKELGFSALGQSFSNYTPLFLYLFIHRFKSATQYSDSHSR